MPFLTGYGFLYLFSCLWALYAWLWVTAEAGNGCGSHRNGIPAWVLGTEPQSLARVASALHFQPFLQPHKVLLDVVPHLCLKTATMHLLHYKI